VGTANSTIEIYNVSTGISVEVMDVEAHVKTLAVSNDGMTLFAGCQDVKLRWFKCTNPGLFTKHRLEGSAKVAEKGRAVNSIYYREHHQQQDESAPLLKPIPSLLVSAVDSTVKLLKFNPVGKDDSAFQTWVINAIVNKSYTIRSCFYPITNVNTKTITTSSSSSPSSTPVPASPPTPTKLTNTSTSSSSSSIPKGNTVSISAPVTPVFQPKKEAHFVVGSEDNIIYIFSYPINPAQSGGTTSQKVTILPGHQAPVLDVGWNSDGTVLASCDANGIVKVWYKL